MSAPHGLPPDAAPAGRLAAATAVSLGVAAVLVVVAVLPVEYGVDPTGAGAALGLLGDGPAAVDDPGPPTGAPALVPRMAGPVAYYDAEYSLDHARFELGPYEYVEYKYRLEQGASMTFAWEASVPVIHDFHAVPDGGGTVQEISFDASEKRRASGVHTAPFPGQHGWYWENPGGRAIAVTLTSAGFYSSALESRSPRVRRPHDLTPLGRLGDAWPLSPAPPPPAR